MNKSQIRSSLVDSSSKAAVWLKSNKTELNASFPTGWIRTIETLRKRWPYLSTEDARTVSCAIQLCDVNRFYMRAYTVSLTAGTMWQWHVTLPVIAVIETLCCRVVAKEDWGLGSKFTKCVNKLHEKSLITTELKKRIEEQRDYRDEVHLYLKEKVEMHDGKPLRHNKAVKVLHDLEDALKKHYA